MVCRIIPKWKYKCMKVNNKISPNYHLFWKKKQEWKLESDDSGHIFVKEFN